jgi:hypothetical protein
MTTLVYYSTPYEATTNEPTNELCPFCDLLSAGSFLVPLLVTYSSCQTRIRSTNKKRKIKASNQESNHQWKDKRKKQKSVSNEANRGVDCFIGETDTKRAGFL